MHEIPLRVRGGPCSPPRGQAPARAGARAVPVSVSTDSGAGRGRVPPPVIADAAAETMVLAELLARCARADAPALQDLYQRAAPRRLGCRLRMLRHRDLAEDALQDVFVQIWQRAAQFDPVRGHPLSWMMTMARYRAIDLMRARRATQSLDEADPGGTAALAALVSPDTSDDYTSLRTTEILDHCFGRLSDPQQQCLTLAYFSGLSHEEVASTVRSPLGTVKSWIRRGLESLRECMSP